MRVAIYARYSSDLQDRRSITDQVALARERAARDGWTVVETYADAAISGASLHNRPGLLDLMVAAEGRRFDAVLAESLDRISRDQEDIAGVHKRLSYLGIKLVTLADGEVNKLHVGIKGLLGALYLDDLAQKTRRGQRGRVAAGRIPGGRCYGYDVAAAEKGVRTINDAEAAIVRRIFAEYVAGRSPLAIVARLNAEGVPGPRGGAWNASALNGSAKRANGILSNSLYAGVLTYNRQRFIKDPATGKRQARENPRSEWITAELPELRVVDAATFESAAARRREASAGPHLAHRRRPKHMLSGLVRCGGCGGPMIVVWKDRVGCSSKINRGICGARRTILLGEIEHRVLAALEAHLLAPDIVAAAVEAYREERARLNAERARNRRNAERDLAAIDRKIAGIVAAIEAGGDPRTLAQRLNALEQERTAIVGRLPDEVGAGAIELHPQAAARYRAKVADIREAMSRGDEAGQEAITLARELVDRIVVHQAPAGAPLALEIVGDLAALMSAGPAGGPMTVVAGARNGRYRGRAIPFTVAA